MSVLRMSALPAAFPSDLRANSEEKVRKNMPLGDVRFSPKAKVRGSNPLGRASDFNDIDSLVAIPTDGVSAECPHNEFAECSRGPPVFHNEKAAGAGNVHGLKREISNLNAPSFAQPEINSKGDLSARVDRYLNGDTTAFGSHAEFIEAFNRLPAVPRQPSRIASAGTAARARGGRAHRSRVETAQRWGRRRMLAATYPIHPRLAWHLTTSQMAYARLVADEVKIKGYFDLSHQEAGARCGMSAKTAQRAQERLKELGWIKVEGRQDRTRPWRNLPNSIRIINPEWLMWIRRATPNAGHLSPRSETKDSRRGLFSHPMQPQYREQQTFRASG